MENKNQDGNYLQHSEKIINNDLSKVGISDFELRNSKDKISGKQALIMMFMSLLPFIIVVILFALYLLAVYLMCNSGPAEQRGVCGFLFIGLLGIIIYPIAIIAAIICLIIFLVISLIILRKVYKYNDDLMKIKSKDSYWVQPNNINSSSLKLLDIIGVVFAFLLPPIGLMICEYNIINSKNIGYKANIISIFGIVISVLFTVLFMLKILSWSLGFIFY